MIIPLDFKPDIDRIIDELRCIHNSDQVCLQTVEGKDFLYGARSGNEFTEPETEFKHFCW